ncbi:MAG: hypothetical protein MUO26_14580 [Methanotrichaceae archaeon]|nr:hypothetical protein [Methanotrichaceae archaeon]
MRKFTPNEIDLLMILSDNRGWPEWDLAKRLNKKESNLSVVLKRLKKERCATTYGYLRIRPYDIIDLESLENKLRLAKDPVSSYVKEYCIPGVRDLLDKPEFHFDFKSKTMVEVPALALSLTYLIDDPSLYDEKRFIDVALSNLTTKLIGQKPQGNKLRLLNRLLLEEAYPNEIAKIRKPIVCEGVRPTTNPKSTQPSKREFPLYINNDFRIFELIANSLLIGRRKHSRMNDQLYDFICSEYVGHFFRKFGKEDVLRFAEGLAKREYNTFALRAHYRGFITFEEYIKYTEYDPFYSQSSKLMEMARELKRATVPDHQKKVDEMKKKPAKGTVNKGNGE